MNEDILIPSFIKDWNNTITTMTFALVLSAFAMVLVWYLAYIFSPLGDIFFDIVKVGTIVYVIYIVYVIVNMRKMWGRMRKLFADEAIFEKVPSILHQLGLHYEIKENVRMSFLDRFDKCYDMGSWNVLVRKTTDGFSKNILVRVSIGPVTDESREKITQFREMMDKEVKPFYT